MRAEGSILPITDDEGDPVAAVHRGLPSKTWRGPYRLLILRSLSITLPDGAAGRKEKDISFFVVFQVDAVQVSSRSMWSAPGGFGGFVVSRFDETVRFALTRSCRVLRKECRQAEVAFLSALSREAQSCRRNEPPLSGQMSGWSSCQEPAVVETITAPGVEVLFQPLQESRSRVIRGSSSRRSDGCILGGVWRGRYALSASGEP